MIPSAESILAAVRTVTGIDPRGSRRNRSSLLSRRVAVYSLRVMRDMSYPEIGEALGVAHSSAHNAMAKAEYDPGVLVAANQVRRLIDKEVA